MSTSAGTRVLWSVVPTYSVPRARWLCVAIGTWVTMRSIWSRVKPSLANATSACARIRPCAHGQALIPVASTPTTRRVPRVDAAAMPIRDTISCVGSAETGVCRAIG